MEITATNRVLKLNDPHPGMLQVTRKRPRDTAQDSAQLRGTPIVADKKRGAYLLDHGIVLGQDDQDALVRHLKAEKELGYITRKMSNMANYLTPRDTGTYASEAGIKYFYAREPEVSRKWTPAMQALKELVEKRTGERYNFALVNIYQNAHDGVDWHADDEEAIVQGSSIASVSLGVTRKFQVREGTTKMPTSARGPIITTELRSGSLVEMRGTMQLHYLHKVPSKPRKKDVAPVPSMRINITFRMMDFAIANAIAERKAKRKK